MAGRSCISCFKTVIGIKNYPYYHKYHPPKKVKKSPKTNFFIRNNTCKKTAPPTKNSS